VAHGDTFAHECVKGREYSQNTARSYCDQATAKLVEHCGLTIDELYGLILFFSTLNINSRYVGKEREAYQDPTTQTRRTLCLQMVPEHRTPLPRPKSLSGLGH